jgi:hypothetical protein
VMSLLANGGRFPLRDMLRPCRPASAGSLLRFSGREAGVDTTKLAYFAVSLVWRGAVHSWHTLRGQTTEVAVRSHMDEMRRHLLSEIPLPKDIVVFVLVCLDMVSQLQSTAPYLVGGHEEEDRYEMLLNGVVFHVALGRPQAEVDYFCCVHSRDRAVFAGDHSKAAIAAAKFFRERALVYKNVDSLG